MKNRTVSIVNPHANQNIRNALYALYENNLLHQYWTSFYWDDLNSLNYFLPKRIVAELKRKSQPREIIPYIKSYAAKEILRQISIKLHLTSFAEQGGCFSPHKVFDDLGKRFSRYLLKNPSVSAVYAYENCAYHVFRAAKHFEIKKIYDLPTPYWRYKYKLMLDERDRLPSWAETSSALNDEGWVSIQKDQELLMADLIVVASDFVKTSILEYHRNLEDKIVVIPYGAPTSPAIIKKKKTAGKLKLLYVGALTQAKGISYLFEAFEKVKDICDLTIVGRKTSSSFSIIDKYLSQITYIESLPHDKVLELMSEQDVFVFPSLYEGFGLVILEAMAQGLLVIATSNTAAINIIENNKDGFVVPIRDAEIIAEKIKSLNSDRDLLLKMSNNAKEKSKLYSWERYRACLNENIQKII